MLSHMHTHVTDMRFCRATVLGRQVCFDELDVPDNMARRAALPPGSFSGKE